MIGSPDRPVADSAPALLSVRGLTTTFTGAPAVHDVSFDLRAGETLCLMGESGSGKSVTALSILRLVPAPGRIAAGKVLFRGRDLLRLAEPEMQQVRGADIGLVFQEPASALDPLFTIGAQIAETLVVHGRAASAAGARAQAIELLRAVSIPEPERRLDDYLHQLSGGLRQRAMIALALACTPALLIADEPTTALDVTLQAQVLDLLRRLRATFELSLLLITHDPGVVAECADRLLVMYAGRVVEQGTVRDVFRSPMHPYTRALLASVPGGAPGARLAAIPGAVPAPANAPPGCPFAPRCAERFEPCDRAVPALTATGPERLVRCYLHSLEAEPAGVAQAARTALEC